MSCNCCIPLAAQELPAANLNALWILLETLNRIAADAAENEMDARALAAALAPTLAWHPPPPKTLSQAPRPPLLRLRLPCLPPHPLSPVSFHPHHPPCACMHTSC